VSAEVEVPQHLQHFYCRCILLWGTLLVGQLVEALRYKLESRGFDFR